MKRVALLIVLQIIAFAGLANAATYRIDLSGSITGGGSINGYFTFDDTGLRHPGQNIDYSGLTSMETDLYIEATLGSETHIFTEDNASVTEISFIGYGKLFNFYVGGDIGGARGITALSSFAPDFAMNSSYTAFLNGAGEHTNTQGGVSYSMSEVTVSAVPLPAAAWMFIAGIVALFGGKWRLKRKMPAIA